MRGVRKGGVRCRGPAGWRERSHTGARNLEHRVRTRGCDAVEPRRGGRSLCPGESGKASGQRTTGLFARHRGGGQLPKRRDSMDSNTEPGRERVFSFRGAVKSKVKHWGLRHDRRWNRTLWLRPWWVRVEDSPRGADSTVVECDGCGRRPVCLFAFGPA